MPSKALCRSCALPIAKVPQALNVMNLENFYTWSAVKGSPSEQVFHDKVEQDFANALLSADGPGLSALYQSSVGKEVRESGERASESFHQVLQVRLTEFETRMRPITKEFKTRLVESASAAERSSLQSAQPARRPRRCPAEERRSRWTKIIRCASARSTTPLNLDDYTKKERVSFESRWMSTVTFERPNYFLPRALSASMLRAWQRLPKPA